MISFDEAIYRLSAAARPGPSEIVSLAQAQGRITAEPICAGSDFPSFPASAMDGYAVRDSDIASIPNRLPVIGKAFAGAGYTGEFPRGTCVRIFTGAPVPNGADRVVMQEDVRFENGTAWFTSLPGERRHIRPPASDFAAGEILVPAGTLLGPQQLVAAAAADIAGVKVFTRPSLYIICCGDELRAPGVTSGSNDAVPESISFGVSALARHWGAQIVGCVREGDNLEKLQGVAQHAMAQADIVVVIGGASVGEKDFAKSMFKLLGLTFLFDKVAIRPGKPIWLAHREGKMVMGLPGNPTSALVTARLFLAPLIAAMAGASAHAALDWRDVTVKTDIPACDDRETFLKARYGRDGVMPLANQDSAAQKALAESDLILRRTPGTPALPAGACVEALAF